jgi:hypothetical protein
LNFEKVRSGLQLNKIRERGGFAMSAAPSNAGVKKAGLDVFMRALEMPPFV